MGALVQGFEYDLFISYRQKDNKGEKWVTRFVEALKTELDATLKDDFTIYFDENPHDGLLETHDVDHSLRDKLKCLVFIPIVSQTYCDPKSFAWRSEFLAFKKYATESDYGLKIRLANGNFTNRILPVRIHDLDAADHQLIENEIGPLRAINFIFKSAGVNRPLALVDDQVRVPGQLLYRDQVNKTANAIKDIIHGLKNTENPPKEKSPAPKPKSGASILSGLGKSAASIKSMAVLPFSSEQDPELQYLGDGIAEEILNSLARLKNLKVAERAASFQFKSTRFQAMEIKDKLGVGTVLTGSVQKSGHQMTINVKLINSQNGSEIWTQQFQQTMAELLPLSHEIALQVIEKLNVSINDFERNSILKTSTHNAAGYEIYLKGRFFFNRQGVDLLKSVKFFGDAVVLDPQFALAWAGLANAHVLSGSYNLIPFNEAMTKAKEAAIKGLEIDPSMMEGYTALAFISMSYEWNWAEAEQYFNKVLSINPNNPSAPERYGLYLKQILNNLQEAEAEPAVNPHYLRAYALLHYGKFNDALMAAQKAVELDPNSFMAHRSLGLSYLGLEKNEEGLEALLVASRLSNRHPRLLFELMSAYILSGRNEDAQAIMEEALSHSHALQARIYNFLFPSTG